MASKNTNKGYSVQTLIKLNKLFQERITFYAGRGVNEIKLSISKGNVKIGHVMNVSIPPILSCGNCGECCHYCYDIKADLLYKNVLDARIRNWLILNLDRDEYFNRIDAAMSRRKKNKYFRWHVAGEIVDLDYFTRMVDNAKKHSDFIVWTYTKNYSVVNEFCKLYGRESIPHNFHIMFSEWDGMQLDNPYNFPIFTCKMPGGNINHPDPAFFNSLYKCPGNCNICKAAGRGCIGNESTYADLH